MPKSNIAYQCRREYGGWEVIEKTGNGTFRVLKRVNKRKQAIRETKRLIKAGF